MKKVLYFIFSFLVLSLGMNEVMAYDTNTYKIDIPEGFIKEDKNDFWKQEKENEAMTIIVQVHKNKNKLNFEDYKGTDLKKENYIQELKETFKDLKEEINIDSTTIEFITVNNRKAIKMNVVSSFLSGKYNSLVYQTQYTIASKNYIYYITISSSNKESLNSDVVRQMINSFTIKDKQAKKDESLTKYYLSISILFASALLCLVLYKRKK